MLGEKTLDVLVAFDVERCLDHRTPRTRANAIARCSLSENCHHRFDKERFAGSCFAGDDVERWAELDFDLLDNCKVLDTQGAKHTASAALCYVWQRKYRARASSILRERLR